MLTNQKRDMTSRIRKVMSINNYTIPPLLRMLLEIILAEFEDVVAG